MSLMIFLGSEGGQSAGQFPTYMPWFVLGTVLQICTAVDAYMYNCMCICTYVHMYASKNTYIYTHIYIYSTPPMRLHFLVLTSK